MTEKVVDWLSQFEWYCRRRGWVCRNCGYAGNDVLGNSAFVPGAGWDNFSHLCHDCYRKWLRGEIEV